MKTINRLVNSLMGRVAAVLQLAYKLRHLPVQSFFVACMIFLVSPYAQAATYTVTTTADSGACTANMVLAGCSLREAIIAANASVGVTDSIVFSIPGPGVQTISPTTALPAITDTVNINGYTQPGAQVATASSPANLLIEISGANAPDNVFGLLLTGVGSSGSSIRGLVINQFRRVTANGHMIAIRSGSGSNWIAGNYLGTNAAGNGIFVPPVGIFGDGISDAGGSSGNNIYGPNPFGPNSANPAADRNIISGGRIGVFEAATGNIIRGNYIGTNASGTAALGNQDAGVLALANNNIIGGMLPGDRNIISGNLGASDGGIAVHDSDGNQILGNYIGTDVTGTLDLGNHRDGIEIANSTNSIVAFNVISGNDCLVGSGGNSANGGGVAIYERSSGNQITDNIIGLDASGISPLPNNCDGIDVATVTNRFGVTSSPTGNSLLRNSIAYNAGLGINFSAEQGDPSAVIPNDLGDADSGANNLQNFPVLSAASYINPKLAEVIGSLDSKPNQSYLIQIFANGMADPSGFGEGQVFIGENTVTTNANGHVDFEFEADVRSPVVIDPTTGICRAAPILTATATDLLTGDTSQFSHVVTATVNGSARAYLKRCDKDN